MLNNDDTLTDAPPITAPVPIILAPRPRRARRVPRWLAALAVVLLPAAALAGAVAGAPTELVRPGEVAAADVDEPVEAAGPTSTGPGATTTTASDREAPAEQVVPPDQPTTPVVEGAPVVAADPAPTTTAPPATAEPPAVTAPATTTTYPCDRDGVPVDCADLPPPEPYDPEKNCVDQGGTWTPGPQGTWNCTIVPSVPE